MPNIDWSSVADGGFLYAELAAEPYENVDIPEVGMSFRYNSTGVGKIRLYRDLERPDRVWILNTAQDGMLSTEDDRKWTVTVIPKAALVDSGADICLAFPMPGSRGTWDCLQRAADARIQGRVYPIDGRLSDADPA